MNMIVTTISEFRSNAKRYVDNIINDNGTLIINRGNTAAVLISLEEYNSIKATQSLLESQTLSQEVTIGIDQLRGGECIEVDIDSL
jgi:antitoxin YefM